MEQDGLRAAICLAGTELVRGERQDANGPWLARLLEEEGVRVVRVLFAPDEEASLAQALLAALEGVDVLVVSGGLGPTSDDLTREALARAAGLDLAEDPQAWAQIVAALAARGRDASAAQRRQALFPRGARALANDQGIAPGLHLNWGASCAFLLPGVPAELQSMAHAHLVPWVRAQPGRRLVQALSLGVAGLPEPEVEAALRTAPELDEVQIGYYPHGGEIEVRFRAQGAGAQARLARAERAARAVLGLHVYGPPPVGRIEHALVARLKEQHLTVATAESVTGGLVAQMLSRVPGASAVLRGGWVTYATELKQSVLGLKAQMLGDQGVVSEAVAREMARAAQRLAASDAAMATTGSAGPDALAQPGHAPVPPGTVCIAATLRGGLERSATLALSGSREQIQRRAAVSALDLLRRLLAPEE